MKKLTIYLCLFLSLKVSAQNLVLNPSFEDTITCPIGTWAMQCRYWYSASVGSPDYFSEQPDIFCSTSYVPLMEEVFYKLMRSDTSWLHLHVPSDSVYIDRYNAGKSGNAGNFATVQDSIASQNYSSASGILTGITSSLEQDLDKKFVLDCYLKYIADTLTLDSATFENLNKVAVQHPLYGGEGVYFARAMLNLDIIDILPGDEESRMANTASPPENKLIDQQDGKLYPSPTKGRVIFEMSSAFGASAKLDIYNSYGSLATSYPLNPNDRSAEFNLSELKPGIYSCRLYNSTNLKMIKKLVIIR